LRTVTGHMVKETILTILLEKRLVRTYLQLTTDDVLSGFWKEIEPDPKNC
jgi:hypothetical protein